MPIRACWYIILSVRRSLAVLLLLVFAALATADGVVCPDGCRSPAPVDRCHSVGNCAFCLGGVIAADSGTASRPVEVALTESERQMIVMPSRPSRAVERPPRLA